MQEAGSGHIDCISSGQRLAFSADARGYPGRSSVGLNQIRILLDSHWRNPGPGRPHGRPTSQEHNEPAGGISVNPTGRPEGLVVQPCTITAFAGQHLAVRRPAAASSHSPMPPRRRRGSRPGEPAAEWEQAGPGAMPLAQFQRIERDAKSIHEGVGDIAQGTQVVADRAVSRQLRGREHQAAHNES